MQFQYPSPELQGGTEGSVAQGAGLGYPPGTSFTPSPSQPGPVAVSSVPAHLPLAAIKPFIWVSGSLVLQVIFKRGFSRSHLTNAMMDSQKCVNFVL